MRMFGALASVFSRTSEDVAIEEDRYFEQRECRAGKRLRDQQGRASDRAVRLEDAHTDRWKDAVARNVPWPPLAKLAWFKLSLQEAFACCLLPGVTARTLRPAQCLPLRRRSAVPNVEACGPGRSVRKRQTHL